MVSAVSSIPSVLWLESRQVSYGEKRERRKLRQRGAGAWAEGHGCCPAQVRGDRRDDGARAANSEVLKRGCPAASPLCLPCIPALPPSLFWSWRLWSQDSPVRWLRLGPAHGRHCGEMVLGKKGEAGVSLTLPLRLGQYLLQQKYLCKILAFVRLTMPPAFTGWH